MYRVKVFRGGADFWTWAEEFVTFEDAYDQAKGYVDSGEAEQATVIFNGDIVEWFDVNDQEA
jgi:hypothetical protein